MSDNQYISFGMAEKYAEEIREARNAESYARHYGFDPEYTCHGDHTCPDEEAEKDAE